MTTPNRKPPLLCACLAWYAETPDTLERCVSSLAGVADVLVALDGRWAEMPGDANKSSQAEWRAIKRAAKDAGVTLEISGAGAPFRSQVAKRTDLMRRGAATGAEWLMVIDGDESVVCGDVGELRAAVARLEGDVAHVTMHQSGVEAKSVDRGVRRLYRASTGVTLEKAHMGYRTADGRWLHGDPMQVTLETPSLALEPLLTIVHHMGARTRERRQAAQRYRIARRAQRIEAWA